MMLLLAVTAMMATPALAAEYEFADSDGPMYAPSTSVDQVIVVGGGVTESSNIDRSKNTAVLAPPFGSPESYLPGAGTAVIPQSNTSTSSTISGDTIYVPPAAYTNVSISKSGYTEVVPGQEIRYTFKDIGNNSTVPLDSFYWRDTLPTDAVRLDKIITGTYSARLNYKVVFQTNLSNTQRVLADNLNTLQNYTLDASPAALGLASNEYVTQVTFLFGRVPGGFRQVETPYIYCDVLSGLSHEYRFANKCDVGGMWKNQWIQATDRWVTIVYRGGPVPTLPRTGY